MRWMCMALAVCSACLWGQEQRLVILDQDAQGPGETAMQSILLLLGSPQVKLLGITVATGDGWRDEEVQHTLRLLEIVGRTDVPVVPGAVFPLLRTENGTEMWERKYGKLPYKGAWSDVPGHHEPDVVPTLTEGAPATRALNEDAAHFLARMVREHPGQITILEGGPMTNIALALSLDPHFAERTAGLVFMGGSLNPVTNDPEFTDSPRREFNLWFDPEASHIVLRAHWPSAVCTPVDVSLKTKLTPALLNEIGKSPAAASQYVKKYAHADETYLWDELMVAAWLNPALITAARDLYMDVDLSDGASYGDTLTWDEKHKPAGYKPRVKVQMDVNMASFARDMVRLLSTPAARAN